MTIPSPDMFDDWADWAAAVKQELEKPSSYAPREAVGRVTDFKGVVSSGYLLCDGSAFAANSFPALFQFLGVAVLPNLVSSHGAGYVVGIKT